MRLSFRERVRNSSQVSLVPVEGITAVKDNHTANEGNLNKLEHHKSCLDHRQCKLLSVDAQKRLSDREVQHINFAASWRRTRQHASEQQHGQSAARWHANVQTRACMRRSMGETSEGLQQKTSQTDWLCCPSCADSRMRQHDVRPSLHKNAAPLQACGIAMCDMLAPAAHIRFYFSQYRYRHWSPLPHLPLFSQRAS